MWAAKALPDGVAALTELSVGDVVRAAADHLRANGSPSPRLDAEVLTAHAMGRDRAWVVAHDDAVVADEVAEALARAVARRATGEPIAYIRGFKDWLSLRIQTDSRALIPRPETELLAEAAIAELESRLAGHALGDRPLVAWDVGTGSGCIVVALGLKFRDAVDQGRLRLIGSDSSRDALALASTNMVAHGLATFVELVESDLLAAVETTGLPRPDVVIANLPYVPINEVPLLPVAASFEPRNALDGGLGGLDLIGSLVAELPDRLAWRGCALLEIGVDQLPDLRAEAAFRALTIDRTLRDLAGVERVVRLVPNADVAPD